MMDPGRAILTVKSLPINRVQNVIVILNDTSTPFEFAPNSIMPHPPRLVVGRDYERWVYPSSMPLGKDIYRRLLLYIRKFV